MYMPLVASLTVAAWLWYQSKDIFKNIQTNNTLFAPCYEDQLNIVYLPLGSCVDGEIALDVSCIEHDSVLVSLSAHVIRIINDNACVRWSVMYCTPVR